MHPLGVLDSSSPVIEVIIDKDTRHGINAYDYFKYKIGREPKTNDRVHFIVATDVLIVADNTSTGAIIFDTRWTINNEITVTNYGFILGRGGRGGQGGDVNNRRYSETVNGNTDVRYATFIPAVKGGNGGPALTNTSTAAITVINNKLIASGGGGGGGSGAWNTDKRNISAGVATREIDGNTVLFPNGGTAMGGTLPANFKMHVWSRAGGVSGTGGSPLGEWVPHTLTADWFTNSFPKGSKLQKLSRDLLTVRGHHLWWQNNPAILVGLNSWASWAHSVNVLNDKIPSSDKYTIDEFDEVFSNLKTHGTTSYDILTAHAARTNGVRNPSAYETRSDGFPYFRPVTTMTLNASNIKSFYYVDHNDSTNVVKAWLNKYDPTPSASPHATDTAPSVKLNIPASDKDVYDNLVISYPYRVSDDTVYGTEDLSDPPRLHQSQLYPFTRYTSSSAPSYVGLYATGHSGYRGGSFLAPYEPSRWHGLIEKDVAKSNFSSVSLIPSKLYKGAGGVLTRIVKEEDYVCGGKGGVLGDDGEAGKLNKIFGLDFEGVEQSGTRFNIPARNREMFHIVEPALGGKGGLIVSGKPVTINDVNGGITRGYTNSTTKQLPDVSTGIITKLNTKFVKPINYAPVIDSEFIAGLDPYDWNTHFGTHIFNMLATNTVVSERANKLILNNQTGKSIEVLTKNIIIPAIGNYSDAIAAISSDNIYMLIPAGYMNNVYSISWLETWFSGASGVNNNQAATIKTITFIISYFLETFKGLRNGVYCLFSPTDISTIISTYHSRLPNEYKLDGTNHLNNLLNVLRTEVTENQTLVVNKLKQQITRDTIEWYRQTGKWDY